MILLLSTLFFFFGGLGESQAFAKSFILRHRRPSVFVTWQVENSKPLPVRGIIVIVLIQFLKGKSQVCSFSDCQTQARRHWKPWCQNLVNTSVRLHGFLCTSLYYLLLFEVLFLYSFAIIIFVSIKGYN